MGERFTDDDLSSDESPKEKDEKRWVKPPLVPNSLDLLRESKEAPPPAPPPPTLLEQVLGKDILTQQEDDDDEDEEESESVEQSPESESVEEAGPEQSDAENTAVEAAQEFVAEGEQAPAEEAPDESVMYIRRDPITAPEQAPPTEDEDEPQQVYASSSSSATPPPPPPPVPPAATGMPNQGPQYNWNMAPPPPGYNVNRYNAAPAPQVSVEQHRAALKETERDSEKRGLRRGLVAGFITGYVLKAYLANRKRERYEKATEKQLNQRGEQINQLQREQQRLTEQMAARVEEYKQRQEAVAKNQPSRFEGAVPKPVAEAQRPPDGEQLFDQEGNEIILQPGWRVERSTGGYSVVLDEHNRVVHDAIRYGEAFKRDQQREQLSDDLFAAVGGGGHASAPADDQFMPPQSGPIGRPLQQQGGVLPAGRKEVDLKHRLPEPRNQLVATVASPWLWTAVALLIIIYFIAALA
jgi:hypothetical protein